MRAGLGRPPGPGGRCREGFGVGGCNPRREHGQGLRVLVVTWLRSPNLRGNLAQPRFDAGPPPTTAPMPPSHTPR